MKARAAIGCRAAWPDLGRSSSQAYSGDPANTPATAETGSPYNSGLTESIMSGLRWPRDHARRATGRTARDAGGRQHRLHLTICIEWPMRVTLSQTKAGA